MFRQVNDVNTLNKFVSEFCSIVDRYVKYIIVSGFVAIISGRARGTENIDMIIEKTDFLKFKQIHEDLVKNNFVCMQSDKPEVIYDYLSSNTCVRYTKKDKPLPEMEIKFIKDEIDSTQITNRIKLPLADQNIWFGSVNYNIAFKEEYLKSDKNLEDARHLRIVYKEIINETEIKEIKKKIKQLRL